MLTVSDSLENASRWDCSVDKYQFAQKHGMSWLAMRTVLTARRREACAWRDTPLGEIVRGDSAKLEERERLAQNLFGLMSARFKSTGDFFKVLDVNGDGVIQHEEFQRSMKKIFKGAFSAEDIRKLFIAADSSGQGNDIVQLLRLGAIATGSELPGEEHGAAPNPTVDAGTTDDTPEDNPYCPYGDGDGGVECHADADLLVMLVVPMLMLMEPASPTSPSADAGTTDAGGGGSTESSIEDLWGISAEAADRLVVKLTEQVNAMPNDRQTLFTDLSAAHEKREKDILCNPTLNYQNILLCRPLHFIREDFQLLEDAFVQKLRELAGVATAEMPNARAAMLEVVEVGRSCDSAHDVNCFQITVLANLLDDPDMYEAAVEGGAEPLPECLATAEKYLAKTVAAWREFPEKWAELVALSSSEDDWVEDDLRKVIDFAMASQSHRLRRLALARGLRAGPAEAAAAGAAEMSTAILAEISQMKTKVTAAGDDDPIHTMVELGVFLLASLVKGARSATLPKLSGADFQAGALHEAARYVWDQKQDHPQIITALCYVLQALSLKLTKWQVQLNDAGATPDSLARSIIRMITDKAHVGDGKEKEGEEEKEETDDAEYVGEDSDDEEVEEEAAEEEEEGEDDGDGEGDDEDDTCYGDWADLAAERQLELRKATEKGETVIHFRERGFPYEIDLKEMTQKNLKSGTTRTIQEVEVPISTLAGDGGAEEEVEAEKPYKWQVSNGKGGWWDFPEDVDAKLKESVQLFFAVTTSLLSFVSETWMRMCFASWHTEVRTRLRVCLVLQKAQGVAVARAALSAWHTTAVAERCEAAAALLTEVAIDRKAAPATPQSTGGCDSRDTSTIGTAPLSGVLRTRDAEVIPETVDATSRASTQPLEALMPKVPANGGHLRGDSTPPPPPPPQRGPGTFLNSEVMAKETPTVEVAVPVLPIARPGGVQWRAAVWPVPSSQRSGSLGPKTGHPGPGACSTGGDTSTIGTTPLTGAAKAPSPCEQQVAVNHTAVIRDPAEVLPKETVNGGHLRGGVLLRCGQAKVPGGVNGSIH
eukprot:s1568_g2.t3